MAITVGPVRLRVCGIVVAACLVALCGALQARAAEPPTAAVALYRQALVVMNDLKEPAFVTFRLEGTGEGMRVDWRTENCDDGRSTGERTRLETTGFAGRFGTVRKTSKRRSWTWRTVAGMLQTSTRRG
jgi:hypothetical protein